MWQSNSTNAMSSFQCRRTLLVVLLASPACALSATGGYPPSLDPHLAPLRPFLGKTWKGAFENSKPGKPTVGVQRWERALNGKAVRLLHSSNDGV